MIDDIKLEISGKGRMLSTGFPTIDDRFGKIYEGDYVVIGANQSHGKTAFAVQMFAEMLIAGKRGIYFTMEIKNEILTRRMIAYMQQVQMFGLGLNTPKSIFEKLSAGTDQIAGFGERMILHDQPAMTPSMIEEKVLQCLAIAPLDFIIIDHIHKMLPDGKSTGQYEKLTVISGALQAIGLKYKIPVIALAQLNRQPSNEDKFPKLSHLRDSGAIEADARKIFLIARPYLYDLNNTEIPKDSAVLIVAKNDKGECGTVDFTYNGPTFTFNVVQEKEETQQTEEF
jgi:replicative DNA helicase